MQAVVGMLLKPILEFIYSKLMDAIAAYIRRQHAKQAIEEANRKAREQTEKAVTPQEREDAAKNIIRRF